MKKEKIYLVIITILVIILGVITFNYLEWRKTSFKLSNELYQVRAKWNIPAYDINENGTIIDSDKNKDDLVESKYTHLIVKEKEDIMTIYTFDENDLLINSRTVLAFDSEDKAREEYEAELKDNTITKVEIKDSKVIHSDKFKKGMTKSDVLSGFTSINVDEEIISYESSEIEIDEY